MLIGKVIGSVWATQKTENLRGLRILVVQPLDREQKPSGVPIAAVDTLGAGKGQLVLVVTGSSAQQVATNVPLPVDAATVSVIDNLDMGTT